MTIIIFKILLDYCQTALFPPSPSIIIVLIIFTVPCFRCDESLWRRVDMSKANLLPGILGKVIKRGTRVLRLAQAKVRKN